MDSVYGVLPMWVYPRPRMEQFRKYDIDLVVGCKPLPDISAALL